MTYINLCPHSVHETNSGLYLEEATEPLRVIYESSSRTQGKVTINKTNIAGFTRELPPIVEGVTYVVSPQALNALPLDRTDFVTPHKPVRAKGAVIGCRDFRERE